VLKDHRRRPPPMPGHQIGLDSAQTIRDWRLQSTADGPQGNQPGYGGKRPGAGRPKGPRTEIALNRCKSLLS
jgi:hypothetical protein